MSFLSRWILRWERRAVSRFKSLEKWSTIELEAREDENMDKEDIGEREKFDGWLDAALDQDEWEREQLARKSLARKVFNFVFKDFLDKLVLMKSAMAWNAKYLLCIEVSSLDGKLVFRDSADGIDPSYVSMMFSRDMLEQIGRLFPKFEWKDTILFSEFPLKLMVESEIGERILRRLEKPFGNLEMHLEYWMFNILKPKKDVFKVGSLDELLVKMDVEADG